MPRLAPSFAPIVLFTLACGDSSGGSTTSDTMVTTVSGGAPGSPTGEPSSDGTDAPSSGVEGSGEASGDSSGGPKLDVQAMTTGVDSGEGCPSVDILFVIDSSGSMADNQQSLVNSFPGFIAGVQSQL